MEKIICKHCNGVGCSLCDLGEVWEDEQDLQESEWEDEQDLQESEWEQEFEVNREEKINKHGKIKLN